MSIHCHWCLISQISGWMICFLDVKQWTLTVIGFWYWECKSWVKADSLHVLVSLSDSDSDFFPWFCCLWRWFIDHKFFLLFAIKFVPFWYNPVNFSISWYLSTFYWTIFVLVSQQGFFCVDIVEIDDALIDDFWYFFAQRSTVTLCFLSNLKYISN